MADHANAQDHRWPTAEEEERAEKPYKECLHAEAEHIDDGKTDIGIIGKKVADACQIQFAQMIDELGQSLTSDERDKLRQSQFDMRTGFGAVEVGRVRLERRSSSQHQ